ncbi:AraC family transcriptional regulator [Agrobacterium fabrum]|uniref:Transcriptional regulator, AraC family n=2 Tax=Agrobacterium fabrum TaxID=1176649 RepID=A9CGU4_AGRFC|nr:transcriptional regulator, AraC family [Agrobacterium fabrum str. C58]AYM60275.1 AraC family transcriptional regulator [Agrobacterium fabrum]KJX85682.1 putative araC-like transcription regulator [Agrobacterium tumefaciens]QRM62110.1 AraC family transcriptional regulator [Agrobacterium fabrum]TRB28506.1 AraC family transcriptional regulator [Agrobacterium fabrum]
MLKRLLFVIDRPIMDPLSDIVDLLRPSAAVSKPISGKGRWGVRYRAHDAPGFALVLAGAAWVMIEGRDPLRLGRGDFLLLPTTPAFSLCSETGVDCVPVEPQDRAVRHGEQEGMPDFLALGGSFAFERINASLLLSLMPGLIYVPAAEKRASRLARLIELLSEECAGEDPGKELIIRRMLEVLLVEALRRPDAGNVAIPAGLVKGMRLPGLARALSAMHADVRASWTVAELAGIAGMSRSAFSARFLEMVGCAPIEYLARWRMALARDSLIRGVKSLDHIADEIGYESASAFSTAFRRRMGIAPGSFARANDRRGQQVSFL